MHGVAEAAGHRVGHAQRVPDGFLHRFGGGEEERGEVVGRQGGDGERCVGVQLTGLMLRPSTGSI